MPPDGEPDVLDDVVELDLGETDTHAQAEEAAPEAPLLTHRRRALLKWWGPRLAWALAGALVGGLAVHAAEPPRPSGAGTLQVALGASGARRLNRRIGDSLTLLVSAVAANRGAAPLEVRGLRVEGEGAGLTETFRGEGSIFPLELAPGETANMPFAVSADCAVGAVETPRVTALVGAPGGPATAVELTIPDLDRAWQRVLSPASCEVGSTSGPGSPGSFPGAPGPYAGAAVANLDAG
jgi:hypothetical protein